MIQVEVPVRTPFGIDIGCIKLWLDSGLHLMLFQAVEALAIDHACSCRTHSFDSLSV